MITSRCLELTLNTNRNIKMEIRDFPCNFNFGAMYNPPVQNHMPYRSSGDSFLIEG